MAFASREGKREGVVGAYGGLIVPAAPVPWIRRGFAKRVLVGMMRKSWNSVRLAHHCEGALAELKEHTGPFMVVMNHHSWWDPLVGLWLNHHVLADRAGFAPMEAKQLAKFGVLKKMGIFGIEPDDPQSLDAMVAYMTDMWATEPSAGLWLTPQGTFADVRAELRLRPGAASVASACKGNLKVFAIATEMVFWTEKRPELLMRIVSVPGPEVPAVSSWHRALTRAMRSNQELLAKAVMSRDQGNFQIMLGKDRDGSTNFFYDLWRKISGKGKQALDVTPR